MNVKNKLLFFIVAFNMGLIKPQVIHMKLKYPVEMFRVVIRTILR